MRALLVQSAATSPWIARRQWEPPSVALATIAAQTPGHDVRVADMSPWRKRAVPRFLRLLKEFRPQVVGFSAMTFQYDAALRFAYLTREFDASILTVLGGYHATLFYEQLAESPDRAFWNFLVRGEGDSSFKDLLDRVEAPCRRAPDLHSRQSRLGSVAGSGAAQRPGRGASGVGPSHCAR